MLIGVDAISPITPSPQTLTSASAGELGIQIALRTDQKSADVENEGSKRTAGGVKSAFNFQTVHVRLKLVPKTEELSQWVTRLAMNVDRFGDIILR